MTDREGRGHYQLTKCPLVDDEMTALLRSGWEPFAVDGGLWLRRSCSHDGAGFVKLEDALPRPIAERYK